MRLFFAGTEQRMWRVLLQNEGVENVSLSYIGLRRRIKDPSNWRIAEHYQGQKVYLDAGTYTLNKPDSTVDFPEAADLAEQYYEFVRANVDAIEFASEFDANVLGLEQIEGMRDTAGIPDEKLMPVWHSAYGTPALEALAREFPRVGVLQDDTNSDLTPFLRRLSGQTMLHGVAMTKMDSMSEIPWSSVGSTSWLSPTQYGDSVTSDTLIWYRNDSGVGLAPIGELWQCGRSFEVRTVDDAGDNVWRPASVVRHKLDPGKKIYEVTTVGHNSIRVTEDHSLFRLRDGGEENVRTSELRVGDRILYGTPELGAGVPSMFVTIPWRNGTMRFGVELDERFCEFLGLFWADGHHDSGGVVVSAGNDPECLRLLEEIAARFAVPAQLRANGVDVRISSRLLSNVVAELGFRKKRAHEKTLPGLVFRMDRHQVAAFLRGYFSGDGCAHRHEINLSSTSPHMLRQVRYLLECFDILPTIGSGQLSSNRKVESRNASYPLLVSDGRSVQNFLREIGFLQARKMTAVVPRKTPPGNNGRRFQPEHGISARYERVTAIEEAPYEEYVYDLSVPGPERFWANGVIAHNTFVWTGRELKRYPKRYKEQARKRHRTWLADNGFNMDLIEADDNAELLRLSIWSWQHFAASLKSNRGVTNSVMEPYGENAERPPAGVDTPEDDTRNTELMPRPGRKLLPVLGVSTHTVTDADGNETQERRLTTPDTGLLRCDTCFMREKCPEMTPGADCAFEIPAKVRTAGQLAAVQDWLIETQTQRVAFMRLIEQAEGGYSDANLSSEIDRLQKLIKTKQDAGKDGFSINIANVASPGGPGILSGIFGSEVTSKMGALPAPVDTQDIVEADIVE